MIYVSDDSGRRWMPNRISLQGLATPQGQLQTCRDSGYFLGGPFETFPKIFDGRQTRRFFFLRRPGTANRGSTPYDAFLDRADARGKRREIFSAANL